MDHREHHDHTSMVESKSDAKEYLKFAGLIVGITVISLLAYSYYGSGDLELWMRYFMGIFFLVFAGFKFIGYKMFVEMFAGYDIIAKKLRVYSYAYPFIELGLAIFYLANLFPSFRDIFTLVIMLIGSIGVFQEIYHRRSGIHCACLGNIIKLPLSTVSLVEDIGMAVMAGVMISLRYLA